MLALLGTNVGVSIMPTINALRPGSARRSRSKDSISTCPVSLYTVVGRQHTPAAAAMVQLLRAANWPRVLDSRFRCEPCERRAGGSLTTASEEDDMVKADLARQLEQSTARCLADGCPARAAPAGVRRRCEGAQSAIRRHRRPHGRRNLHAMGTGAGGTRAGRRHAAVPASRSGRPSRVARMRC